MKKHLQIGNWSHFSGEARQPNGDPRLITTMDTISLLSMFLDASSNLNKRVCPSVR